MCESLGMNTRTAFNMFVKDCIKKRSILGLNCEPEEVDENGFTKRAKWTNFKRALHNLSKGKLFRKSIVM